MIDWVAVWFTLCGTAMQAWTNEKVLMWSFCVLFVGNALWFVFALTDGIYSMLVTGVLFGVLNAVAFYRWWKKAHNRA